MAVPVAFAFDFEAVMTLAAARFLPENFALSESVPLDGDDAFGSLNFDYMYHDSKPPSDVMQQVRRARMAEVVVADELSLDHCRAIVLRNDFDRRSLLYATRQDYVPRHKLVVEQRGGTFMRQGISLEEVSVAEGALILSFGGPSRSAQAGYDVQVTHGRFQGRYTLEAGRRWRITTGESFEEPVRVEVEGCLAFEAHVPAGSPTVV